MTNDSRALENYKKYLETYSGKALLREHQLTDRGIWKIRGEDPNCDFGGHHHMPELGIVEGVLEDVIMYGCNLPRFWQWGGGGSFELVGQKIPTIDKDSLRHKAELEDELKKIEQRAAEIKRQLGKK